VVRTWVPKKGDIKKKWYVIDADGVVLGRLAARVAAVLRGKHKPVFSPFIDTGDFVVVVNAGKIKVTGKKLEQKKYYSHSGYPGHLKERSLAAVMAKHPDRVVTAAVKGMLPHNKLGRAQSRKLKVYAGAEHPHKAQQPEPLEMV